MLEFAPNLTSYHTLVFGDYCHSQTEVQNLAQNETGQEAAAWQVICSMKTSRGFALENVFYPQKCVLQICK